MPFRPRGYLWAHDRTAVERGRCIDDDLICRRKTQCNLYCVPEVLAKGDWCKLHMIAADHGNAQSLLAEQQRVRRNCDGATGVGKMEMHEYISTGAEESLCVVDVHLDVERARGKVNCVGIADDRARY